MNPAREQIIRMYLQKCPVDSQEIDIFMHALVKGCELNQANALALADEYFALAKTLTMEPEEAKLLDLLIEMDRAYVLLEQDEVRISALERIREALSQSKDNEFSRRVVNKKVAAILQELERRLLLETR